MEKILGSVLPYTKTLTLLYVEKEDMLREAYKNIFESLFETVYVAKDAQEGMWFWANNSIDMLITDFDMPIMNGLDLAKTIKQNEPLLPIIMMAEEFEKNLFTESIEIGVDAYLIKPIEEEQLYRVLHRISNQSKTTKALQEKSQYFEILIENSIVTKVNLEGQLTYVNNKFCNTFGYERSDVIGKHNKLFCWNDASQKEYDSIWNLINSGQVWHSQIQSIKKDGTIFDTDVLIIPLKNEKKIVQEFIVIRHDISEIMKMKATIESEERRKKETELINKAKESFLVLFTHELRTPLNAIINFSKYLHGKVVKSETVDPEKMAMLLKSIIENGRNMLQNVNDILDISKLQAHKMTFKKESFDPNKLIIDVLKELDSLIDSKGIQINIQADEVEIYSDKQRVKQILINIVSNAIKYGQNMINVSIIKKYSYIEIIIEDNGEGIRNKNSVFELYEQNDIDLTLGREKTGTGVGLYFVKLMCDNLDIGLELQDSALGGASFKFTFEGNKI